MLLNATELHAENPGSGARYGNEKSWAMTAQVQNHTTLAVAHYYAFLIWPDTRVIVQGTTLDSVCDGNKARRK